MDLLENNQFLISKAKRIIEVNQNLSYKELKQKLLRHLMSKGFDYATSSKALSDLL